MYTATLCSRPQIENFDYFIRMSVSVIFMNVIQNNILINNLAAPENRSFVIDEIFTLDMVVWSDDDNSQSPLKITLSNTNRVALR